MTMPEKIWAWGTSSKLEAQNNTRPNRSWWFDVGDLRKSNMPHCKEYIRKDLADELARALKEAGDVIECYHKTTGIDLGDASRMPFYSDTIEKIDAALGLYEEATEGK